MKLHIAVDTPNALAELADQKALRVVDVSADRAYRALWRTHPAIPLGGDASQGLPAPGYRSPMGYWLAPAADGPGPVAGPRILFGAPGEEASPLPAYLAQAPGGPRSRPVQTVRLKSPNSGEGEVILTIGAGGARVITSPAAWRTLAEPVLLAACQYWRFVAIDAELARLTELAKADLGHATMPTPASLRAGKTLAQSAEDARALLLDLPHFEGPLTDPYAFSSTERSAQLYETLAEKLRLEAWCELIDERAEAVEDTYEAVTEKLFEYKNFAWEAVLEALIIVILLAELGLSVFDMFFA